MGFFSELRKLFYAKRSVAKSTTEKIKDEAGEKLDQLSEKAGDLRDQGEEKLDSLVEAFTSDKVDTHDPEPEDKFDGTTEEMSIEENIATRDDAPTEETVFDKVGKKTLQGMENLGERTLEASEEAGERLEDLAKDVGKKVFEGAGKLKDEARKATEYLDQKLDETVEKARELDEELNKNDQDGDGLADEPADLSKGTLEGSDDFFEKAKRFAKGQPLSDEPQLSDERAKTDKPTYKAYGMEDKDGDGNELIDDAIIDEQE